MICIAYIIYNYIYIHLQKHTMYNTVYIYNYIYNMLYHIYIYISDGSPPRISPHLFQKRPRGAGCRVPLSTCFTWAAFCPGWRRPPWLSWLFNRENDGKMMRNYRGFYGDLLGSQCFYYSSISSPNMHTLCSFKYIYIVYIWIPSLCTYYRELPVSIYICVVSIQVDERP